MKRKKRAGKEEKLLVKVSNDEVDLVNALKAVSDLLLKSRSDADSVAAVVVRLQDDRKKRDVNGLSAKPHSVLITQYLPSSHLKPSQTGRTYSTEISLLEATCACVVMQSNNLPRKGTRHGSWRVCICISVWMHKRWRRQEKEQGGRRTNQNENAMCRQECVNRDDDKRGTRRKSSFKNGSQPWLNNDYPNCCSFSTSTRRRLVFTQSWTRPARRHCQGE